MPRTYGQLWSKRASSSVTDEDSASHSDGYDDDSSELSELPSDSEYTPDTEDELPPESECDWIPHDEFKLRQTVLVRPRRSREWYEGVVVKIRQPAKEDKRRGSLYIVVFKRYNTNIRDCFSPYEGNIKPSTPRLRARLLGAS